MTTELNNLTIEQLQEEIKKRELIEKLKAPEQPPKQVQLFIPAKLHQEIKENARLLKMTQTHYIVELLQNRIPVAPPELPTIKTEAHEYLLPTDEFFKETPQQIHPVITAETYNRLGRYRKQNRMNLSDAVDSLIVVGLASKAYDKPPYIIPMKNPARVPPCMEIDDLSRKSCGSLFCPLCQRWAHRDEEGDILRHLDDNREVCANGEGNTWKSIAKRHPEYESYVHSGECNDHFEEG